MARKIWEGNVDEDRKLFRMLDRIIDSQNALSEKKKKKKAKIKVVEMV